MYELFGRIIYRILWPLLVVYEPLTHRTRIIVRCGDEILLIRAWLSAGTWQLPGGGVHSGERPEQAVVRELHEETGVTVSSVDVRVVGAGRILERPGYRYTLYMVDIAAKPDLRLRQSEIVAGVWLTREDALASLWLDPGARVLLRQFG